MFDVQILWDLEDDPDGNVQHIAGNGVTVEDIRDAAQKEEANMKVSNVYGDSHRTPAQKAKEKEVRRMFQDWKPGPEELLDSGKWKGPIIVEGAQEFWKAIRHVRAYREARGLTLKDVSERCGIDVATLSKLENGKQENPTLFTMLLYVGAVGKRLCFSVRERPRPAIEALEIREAGTTSNGTPRARRMKAKARHEAKLAEKRDHD
jgi:transcriptional regulator with XRE-family HTH domain